MRPLPSRWKTTGSAEPFFLLNKQIYQFMSSTEKNCLYGDNYTLLQTGLANLTGLVSNLQIQKGGSL